MSDLSSHLSRWVKIRTPWYLKMIVKMILSCLPVAHRTWRQLLPLFQHGPMHSPEYVYSIFNKHFSTVQTSGSFVCLELGPGESLCSVLVAKAFGAGRIYLVDVEDCACRTMSVYNSMQAFLSEKGYHTGADLTSFDSFMQSCRATYVTEGLHSLRQLSDDCIDFLFSNAVLEHIRRSEISPMLTELARILKPDGISAHVVDLRDHLGASLNNLRFSDMLWESDVFAKSGFYTNRIRFSEMLSLFDEAGFNVDVLSKKMWPVLPIRRGALHGRFRQFSNQDLNVMSFMVSLTLKKHHRE